MEPKTLKDEHGKIVPAGSILMAKSFTCLSSAMIIQVRSCQVFNDGSRRFALQKLDCSTSTIALAMLDGTR